MPRGFAGETVAQEARGGSRASVARGRTSAYGGRSRGMGSAARAAQDRGIAVREVQQREERARSSMANVPSLFSGLALGLGSAVRREMVRQLEAGGTPVRTNGVVTGVMLNGRYFGRPRPEPQTEERAQPAQAATTADEPPADEPAGPPVVRRSKLAQQIEEENRRRRLAGLRRLGSRTLLSGDRFTADTLGVG